MSEPVNRRIECLLRDLAPRALGAVVRQVSDFGASEDAVQEALIAAADQWPRNGIPDNPLGWVIRVAQRRLTDHMRVEISRRNREAVVGTETQWEIGPASYDDGVSDDALVLLFMCCHPALTPASRDRAYAACGRRPNDDRDRKGVPRPESTIGQRISRAKAEH